MVHCLTHLLEGFGLDTGSDGSYPYSYNEGLNFTMNLGIDTIDFATFHLYPSSCTYIISPLPLAWTLLMYSHQGEPLMIGATGGSNPTELPVQQLESPVSLKSTVSLLITVPLRLHGRRQRWTPPVLQLISTGSMETR